MNVRGRTDGRTGSEEKTAKQVHNNFTCMEDILLCCMLRCYFIQFEICFIPTYFGVIQVVVVVVVAVVVFAFSFVRLRICGIHMIISCQLYTESVLRNFLHANIHRSTFLDCALDFSFHPVYFSILLSLTQCVCMCVWVAYICVIFLDFLLYYCVK